MKDGIYKRLHKCVDIALSPLLPWEVNQPEEKILLHPVLSIEHVHYIVDKLFQQICESGWKDAACEQDEYYVNIDETPGIHPAYMLGTFIVLLLAKPKKIWVECFLSNPDKDAIYLGNPVTGRLLKRLLKEFSELELVRFEEDFGQKRGIEFVNEHPTITHVVEIGEGTGSFWKKRYYQHHVTLHYPTALFVWMQYSAPDKVEGDKLLAQFGEYCFEESYSYWCDCDRGMDDFTEEVGYLGISCHGGNTWNFFITDWQKYFDTESLPVLVFHDTKLKLEVPKYKSGEPVFQMEDGTFYDPDKVYYDFQNLFKRREGK